MDLHSSPTSAESSASQRLEHGHDTSAVALVLVSSGATGSLTSTIDCSSSATSSNNATTSSSTARDVSDPCAVTTKSCSKSLAFDGAAHTGRTSRKRSNQHLDKGALDPRTPAPFFRTTTPSNNKRLDRSTRLAARSSTRYNSSLNLAFDHAPAWQRRPRRRGEDEWVCMIRTRSEGASRGADALSPRSVKRPRVEPDVSAMKPLSPVVDCLGAERSSTSARAFHPRAPRRGEAAQLGYNTRPLPDESVSTPSHLHDGLPLYASTLSALASTLPSGSTAADSSLPFAGPGARSDPHPCRRGFGAVPAHAPGAPPPPPPVVIVESHRHSTTRQASQFRTRSLSAPPAYRRARAPSAKRPHSPSSLGARRSPASIERDAIFSQGVHLSSSYPFHSTSARRACGDSSDATSWASPGAAPHPAQRDPCFLPTSMVPPITRMTLKELDLNEILKSSQLRHDIVFDPNLMFRPNYDGQRGDRKKKAAEQYWESVTREVVLRCRCTAFVVEGRLSCICGAGSLGSLPLADRFPSRTPPLVLELRNILISLLPGSSAENARDEVMEMLDPDFIAQQLERGVLDVPRLADYLGATLKLHCAPMRDHMVDAMVETCKGDDTSVALGLRKCFEILELMKLDIANHQLRSFRPFLVGTALDFERQHLQENLKTEGFERTRKWLASATTSTSNVSSTEAARASDVTRHGILDLIFASSTSGSPASARHPETFRLDTFRLHSFHADATDLTVVYLLLMLFQQLVSPSHVTPTDLEELRREIWCIMSATNATRSSLAQSKPGSVAVPSPVMSAQGLLHGIAKFERPSWREAMKQVGVQIAARATQIHHPELRRKGGVLPPPNSKMVTLVESYLESHLRADSKVFQLLRSRVQASVSAVLEEELERASAPGQAPWWTVSVTNSGVAVASMPVEPRRSRRAGCTSARSSTIPVNASLMAQDCLWKRGTKRSLEKEDDADSDKRARLTSTTSVSSPNATSKISALDAVLARSGLTPLVSEVKVLGERIAKMTSFHLAIYSDYYQSLLDA